MMRRIVACLVWCIAATTLVYTPGLVGQAEAQTMTPREIRYQWKKAARAYRQKKYERASMLLFDIIENGAALPGFQRSSRYMMAGALFRQDLKLVSLRYIIQLLSTTKTSQIDQPFLNSLRGLLRIAQSIGDETLVVKMLRQVKPLLRTPPKGKDPINFLLALPERYKKSAKRTSKWRKRRKRMRNTLAYFLGRMNFLKRSKKGFFLAHRFFNVIKPEAANNYYAKALYMKGVMYAWRQRNKNAIKQFRKILTLKANKPKFKNDLKRIKEYAQYGIARAFYAQGARTKGRAPKLARKILVRSLREYSRLSKQRGVFQAQVLFETAYVHFWLDQYHFALGKLIALQSPYYLLGFFPELQILRALIYYRNCKYEDTKQTVFRFEKKYQPLKKQLKEIVARRKKKKWLIQYFEYYLKQEQLLKAGQKTEIPSSIVARLGEEKSLKNYRLLLDKLTNELKIIRSKGARWKESNLGRSLLEVALGFRTTLKKFAGANIWRSMRQVLRELSKLLSDSGVIQLETLQAQKKELMRYAEGGGIEQDEYRYTIVTEQSHTYWPYQGEYWRDEIGNYREFIQGECKQ